MLILLLACTPKSDRVPLDDSADQHSAVDDSGGDSSAPDSPADDSGPDDSGTGDCTPESCDDGLDCTTDACDDQGRCVYSATDVCEWPASMPPDVTALGGLDEDFEISLSGATWNAATRELWVIRGNGATGWTLVEDGAGGWAIDQKVDLGRLDLESVTLTDPDGAPGLIHVVMELDEMVTAFDVSSGTASQLTTWDTSPWLPTSGSRGSEGLAFVPDDALEEWGFVDGDGAPRTSALGYGGLFFVGTQNGGSIHVFDLSSTDDAVDHVGEYGTSREDTSGLEFDAGTGRLYVWHGGDDNDLEIVRLSSTEASGARSFDTEMIFDYDDPDVPNIEGIALMGTEDCVDGERSLFFTIDDGFERALDVYTDWPLCPP